MSSASISTISKVVSRAVLGNSTTTEMLHRHHNPYTSHSCPRTDPVLPWSAARNSHKHKVFADRRDSTQFVSHHLAEFHTNIYVTNFMYLLSHERSSFSVYTMTIQAMREAMDIVSHYCSSPNYKCYCLAELSGESC
jgi:hypothetical protein